MVSTTIIAIAQHAVAENKQRSHTNCAHINAGWRSVSVELSERNEVACVLVCNNALQLSCGTEALDEVIDLLPADAVARVLFRPHNTRQPYCSLPKRQCK